MTVFNGMMRNDNDHEEIIVVEQKITVRTNYIITKLVFPMERAVGGQFSQTYSIIRTQKEERRIKGRRKKKREKSPFGIYMQETG